MNAPQQHPPAVRTTCPYCGVGCGVLAKPDGLGGAAIEGDPQHPANFGRLCSKGSALGETLGLSTRLLHPMQRRGDTLARVTWDAALDQVANGFKRIIERDGPDAVAFYLSGQLLTEDYYVANKLMKGFIGSANVDTNSRLCMASSVAGHRRAFGGDVVPGCYADLDEADLIVLTGSNAAWCHPILFQRMVANRRDRGTRIVVIDPRRTATCEDADLFLPIAPGMDTVLFCGLLTYLVDSSAIDADFVAGNTSGFAETLARAREIAPTLDAVAQQTELPAKDIVTLYNWFAEAEKTVTCYSQGVNQSAQGTDKVNAIINCHLATGRVGRPGMGPFSLTGQPNAMGGREVGGLANQLAAHMGFLPDDIDRVGRFWNATAMAEREGLKAVPLFDAIARGEVKALWVMGTNPAVSLPRAGAVREALRNLELFVVSEVVASNDTVACGPHVLLPATAWGEKDGTVTNSERRISRQRRFLPAPGEARPDWWMVTEVARRMGFAQAFPYRSAADIFREHAALSGFENDGTRAFDISDLATLSDGAFDALDPVQWPHGRARLFDDGHFVTPDHKGRFIPPEPAALADKVSDTFPLRLNTGRVRDQWHTMTRTGLSPRLGGHCREPFVIVHPRDAEAAGLTDAGYARVTTAHGACVLKVAVSNEQRPGSLFAPIHWSDATAAHARIGELVTDATDPWSGQPESKATPAAIAPVTYRFHGLVLADAPPVFEAGELFTRIALNGGSGALFATDAPPDTWPARARKWIGADAGLAEYADLAGSSYRAARLDHDRLTGCVAIGPEPADAFWDLLTTLMATDGLTAADRRALLSGARDDATADLGPLVCACFAVRRATIEDFLAGNAAGSVEAVGRALKAGTNCGSCLPELKRIVAHVAAAETV